MLVNMGGNVEIPWGALAALAIYIVGSTVGFIWWMATITVTMQYMKEALDRMVKDQNNYATKLELAEKIVGITLRLDKAWDKIDVLNNGHDKR